MPAPARLLRPTWVRLALGALVVGGAFLNFVERPLTAPLPDRIAIADLTWVELREAVRQGYTTAIVPSGGLEQNGPHLAIAKHDRIVAHTSNLIAARLGHTLVAPVISYVPEGEPGSGRGHMRYPGTIGVSEAAFEAVLDGIARSLKSSGFRVICFLADSSDTLPAQRRAAERLSRDWAGEGVRVVGVEYGADAAQLAWLRAVGETPATIGRHGGIQDTAELLVADPSAVRIGAWTGRPGWSEPTGSDGEPSRATAEQGRALLAMKVDAAVAQIDAARGGGLTLRGREPD